MITALLSLAFIWCLFYGRLPVPVLAIFGISLALFLYLNNRHKHTEFISIDVVAQFSRLKTVNATLKIITLLALMIVSVALSNAYTGVFLVLAMLVLAVFVGGIKLHEYIQILALPVSFLLIGGLALLFEVRPEAAGVLGFNLFGLWFTVSAEAQLNTALVIARSLGAISCLIVIGMSTPMPEIIAVLRRFRCPELIIDLMYLIYRYIFILLALYHEMNAAAKSRLGLKDYRTSLRTTARVYSNLLARSHHFASQNFDAMESRCFDQGIRFLEQCNNVRAYQVAVSVALLLVTLAITIVPLFNW